MTTATLAPGWSVAPFNTGTSLQSKDWPGVHIVTARRTGYDVPPSFLTGEKVVVWMLHESGETHRTAYDSLDDALAEYTYIEQAFDLAD